MYWVPIAGQPGANGGVTMAPYPFSMLPPGMMSVPPNTTAQAGTPPAFNISATNIPTPPQQQLPQHHQQHHQQHVYGACLTPVMQSADFSAYGGDGAVHPARTTPPQQPPQSGHSSGSGPFTASLSASMAGSSTTDARPVFMMSATGGMTMGYAPHMNPGYVPVGTLPMMPSGSYYTVSPTSMAVYPSSEPLSQSPSGAFVMGAAPPMTLQNPSGVFSAQTSGDFTSAVSFSTVPQAFSGVFAPQSTSDMCRNKSAGAFRPSTNRSGKTGDAGRGYEAGVYYEGRVKRFNPVRGYGFLSATHKLLRLRDVRACKTTTAIETSANTLAPTAESHDTAARRQSDNIAGNEKSAVADASSLSSPWSAAQNDKGNSTNPKAVTTTITNATASVTSEASAHDVPSINVISATGEGADPEIDLADIVLIKGEEYVRKPVVMGDIFVHYHCLQRTPAEMEGDETGALVNLPAGARVQFKAEVFVPAKLMEEAQDSKQAAAMLNNIGIPVEDDPNLLAGAIATKKGWGYQAMDVVQLPSQQPAKDRLRSRRGHGGRARSTGNASTASHSSVNSARRSNTPSQERSGRAKSPNALAPCSGQHLNIRVDVEGSMPPPPSFESATAGMQYTMPAAGGLVYYPAYPSAMPR